MTVRSAPPIHYLLEDHTVYRFASQLSRLRPIVLLVAAGTVGACADDQSITSPHPDAATPSLAGANATPEATDPNVLAITVTPGKTGTIGTRTGIILLNVTTTCSKAGALIRLGATLTQYDRRTGAGVTGSGEIDFGCTTNPLLSYIPVTMAPLNPDPRPGKVEVLFKVLTPDVIAPDVQRSVRLVEQVGG